MAGIKFELHVKFRAFGVDFGKQDFIHTYAIPVPIPIPGWPNGHVIENYNSHGVVAIITLVTI